MNAPLQTRFPSRLDHAAVADSAVEPDTTAVSERRCELRHAREGEAVVIPIVANFHPASPRPGQLCDISRSGIGFIFSSTDQLEAECFVVGLPLDGVMHYATVETRFSQPLDTGSPDGSRRLRIGGRFIEGPRDPLDPSKLQPRFDRDTLRFAPPLAPAAITQWLAHGVLQPRPMDRIKVCPECRSLPSFRHGCLKCGSANISANRLLRHFACDHVGQEAEFVQDNQGKAFCPRCQASGLTVGVDIDYLPGPTTCGDCDWTCQELCLIGECLQCGVRFRGEEAVEEELTQFWVQRLNPLAWIDDEAVGSG